MRRVPARTTLRAAVPSVSILVPLRHPGTRQEVGRGDLLAGRSISCASVKGRFGSLLEQHHTSAVVAVQDGLELMSEDGWVGGGRIGDRRGGRRRRRGRATATVVVGATVVRRYDRGGGIRRCGGRRGLGRGSARGRIAARQHQPRGHPRCRCPPQPHPPTLGKHPNPIQAHGWWSAGERPTVRRGHLDRRVRQQLQPPLRVVGEVVMVTPTQQHQVVAVGGSAVLPRGDVMRFALRHRPVTTREPAAPVPYRQGTPNR